MIGLGEAGMREAGKGGRRFSIVTLGAAMRDLYRRARQEPGARARARRYSHPLLLDSRLGRESRITSQRILAAIRACKGEAVLLGGAPFAGLGADMTHETGTLILDGVAASVAAAPKSPFGPTGSHDATNRLIPKSWDFSRSFAAKR